MKALALKLRDAATLYLKWAWPLVLADAACRFWLGDPQGRWRSALNGAAFAWVLCAPLAPLRLLFDRALREKTMARICGLREGDERERWVTAEAARSTLLLSLALQAVFLALTMVSVHVVWNPAVKRPGHRGTLEVGMSFSSSRHLDPFGAPEPEAPAAGLVEFGGYALAPSAFPVLALLILVQLAAFRAFAVRRYEGEGE